MPVMFRVVLRERDIGVAREGERRAGRDDPGRRRHHLRDHLELREQGGVHHLLRPRFRPELRELLSQIFLGLLDENRFHFSDGLVECRLEV